MAEHLFHMPILYVEYSGTFGEMDLLAAARSPLRHTRLWYGGGIDSLQRANQVLAWADTIVVGNIIYEDLDRALETVRCKEEKPLGKGIDENE
jgi:putative glycerol-1-phosphate prenyltransferase